MPRATRVRRSENEINDLRQLMCHMNRPFPDRFILVPCLNHRQMLLFENAIVEKQRLGSVEGNSTALPVAEDMNGSPRDIVHSGAIVKHRSEKFEPITVSGHEVFCIGLELVIDENADGGYIAGVEDVHVGFGIAGCVSLLDFVDGRLSFEREGCVGTR